MTGVPVQCILMRLKSATETARGTCPQLHAAHGHMRWQAPAHELCSIPFRSPSSYVASGHAHVLHCVQVSTDWAGLIDEWALRFFQELDYKREAQNSKVFAQQMAHLDGISVCQVFPELSSRNVLTTAWVQGVLLCPHCLGSKQCCQHCTAPSIHALASLRHQSHQQCLRHAL